jgi:hypothetical protein
LSWNRYSCSAHAMKAQGRRRGTAPLSHNLNARSSSRLRSDRIAPRTEHRSSMKWRFGGSQIQSRRVWWAHQTLSLTTSRSSPIHHPFHPLYCLYPTPPNIQQALYADDIAILSQSWRHDTIERRLTSAMTQLVWYFHKWKLRVNVSKTELILFTKRRPLVPPSRHLQNTTISWPETVKYLGLLSDSKLLFTRHLHTVRHKATGTFLQMFRLLARDSSLTTSTKILLHKTLLRSMFTYAAPG